MDPSPAKTVKLEEIEPMPQRPRRPGMSLGKLWKTRFMLAAGAVVGTLCFVLWTLSWPAWVQDRAGPFAILAGVVSLWQALTWKPGK